MARVRYVGPEPVTVPELGDREVQPDEIVTVPDERFEGYVCQTTNWESVEEPKPQDPEADDRPAAAVFGKKTAAKSAPQKLEG